MVHKIDALYIAVKLRNAMPATATQEQEAFIVSKTSVPCDGGAKKSGGALGHPKVYLKVDPTSGDVTCPYCSRRYVLDPNVKVSGAH